MKRRAISMVVLAVALALGGCVTSPKQTVLNLDTTDRKWTSKRCVAARKAVYEWNDRQGVRTAVNLVGNLVVPFAGTGANLAIGASQRHKREELNRQVDEACISRTRPPTRQARR